MGVMRQAAMAMRPQIVSVVNGSFSVFKAHMYIFDEP